MVKSHKGSQIFKQHGFPYYTMMYELLGKTPIAGGHRIGTSTTNKRVRDPSLTPSERRLDDSISDQAPDEHRSQVIRLQSDGKSLVSRSIRSVGADLRTCFFKNR